MQKGSTTTIKTKSIHVYRPKLRPSGTSRAPDGPPAAFNRVLSFVGGKCLGGYVHMYVHYYACN